MAVSENVNVIKKYITETYQKANLKFNGKDKSALIVLDGWNELFSSANEEQFSKIRAGIEDLFKTDTNQQLSFVVTSRDFSINDKKNIFKGFEETRLSDVPESYLQELFTAFDDSDSISDNIKELAKSPMYYNLISECANTQDVSPNTEYDIFYRCYIKRINQRLSDKKATPNKPLYKYYAFAFLPKLAYYMINNHSCEKYEISSDDWGEILQRYVNNQTYNDYIHNLTNYVNEQLELTTFRQTNFDYNDIMLCFEDDAIIKKINTGGYDSFCFAHEEWRAFLCAFHLSRPCLKKGKECTISTK